jgi:co-chaperonin GroES (HSP10)
MIIPAAGHLLVLPCVEEETKSGIILDVKTVKALNPYIRSVVVERGASTPKRPMLEFRHNISNGKEVVLMPRNAGTVYEYDGIKYRIVNVDDIIGFWTNLENQ